MSNINNQSQNLFAIDVVQDLDNESAVTFSGGAGPYILSTTGESRTFPTWGFGGSTRLCVQSLDPNNFAGVTIHGNFAAPEEVGTGGGAINCIDRNWGGAIIRVENSRNELSVPVRVWTV